MLSVFLSLEMDDLEIYFLLEQSYICLNTKFPDQVVPISVTILLRNVTKLFSVALGLVVLTSPHVKINLEIAAGNKFSGKKI